MALFGLFSKEKKDTLDKGLEKSNQSFFSKLTKAVLGKSKVDAEVLDELEEILITSDVGVDTTVKIIDRIEERVSNDKYSSASELDNILREEITTLLINRKLLLEPIVDIRYLNYKVSILGEVKNPSVLTIPSEKISILEALGLAGDITIFGRRDNITLIREENGVKRMRILDLTSNEIFSSPYYYLKSNDIIYVQPNNAKVASSSGIRDWIPVILSAISFLRLYLDHTKLLIASPSK